MFIVVATKPTRGTIICGCFKTHEDLEAYVKILIKNNNLTSYDEMSWIHFDSLEDNFIDFDVDKHPEYICVNIGDMEEYCYTGEIITKNSDGEPSHVTCYFEEFKMDIDEKLISMLDEMVLYKFYDIDLFRKQIEEDSMLVINEGHMENPFSMRIRKLIACNIVDDIEDSDEESDDKGEQEDTEAEDFFDETEL